MSSTKNVEQTNLGTCVNVRIEADAPLATKGMQKSLQPCAPTDATGSHSTEWVATYAKRTTVLEPSALAPGSDTNRRMIEEVALAGWVVRLIILTVISLGAVAVDHSFGWIGKLMHVVKVLATYVIKWMS